MEEKRTYLRQALEARLMALYFDTKNFKECLSLGQRLYSELKKLDDKALLVEIQLTESKVASYLTCFNLILRRTTRSAIYRTRVQRLLPQELLLMPFTVLPGRKPILTCKRASCMPLKIRTGKLHSGRSTIYFPSKQILVISTRPLRDSIPAI